jgi:peptidoglycan/LPS O-acetylase OafA/YrhL
MAAATAPAPHLGLMPGPRHAFGLDLIRAVAVSSVLLAHGSLFYAETYPAARDVLIVFGVVGVEIFFALSGFLVGRQLLLVPAGDASAYRFLLRRWFRTLPNYYLFLGVNAALVWWVIDRAGPQASFLVFAQSLLAPATTPFFPESWSLAVEEWFYGIAALAFALAAAIRLSPRGVAVMLVAVLVIGPFARYVGQLVAVLPMDAGVRKISLLRLDALAFGVGAAWLERYRGDWFEWLTGWRSRALSTALTGASVAALVVLSRRAAFFEPAHGDAERIVVSVLFSALPLAAALWLPWLSRWGAWNSMLARPVGKLSLWSYSLYLTHFPTLLVLLALWPVAKGNAIALVARSAVWLAVAMLVAAAVYAWYERPLTMLRPELRRPGAK